MEDLLTNILLMLAITMASLAVTLVIVVMARTVWKFFPKLPTLKLPSLPERKQEVKEIKKERRTESMSKQASEGITFNDIFMFMIAVPLVLLWVGFAGFVIHTGLNNSAVLENIEAYTTLIAILGGPALLIIKDALDVWKQEQAEKTAFYKTKAQAVIDYNDATQKQAQMIESKQQEQEHKIETGTTLPKKK
tara:strand:+ start:1855 stop:2430 length:576 start_codon:yes stop_codon:yes gene_type:complete